MSKKHNKDGNVENIFNEEKNIRDIFDEEEANEKEDETVAKEFIAKEVEKRMEVIRKNTTKRLRNLLNGRTQNTEAQLIGINRTVYNKILNGKYKFTLEHISMFALYYQTTEAYIMGQTDKK